MRFALLFCFPRIPAPKKRDWGRGYITTCSSKLQVQHDEVRIGRGVLQGNWFPRDACCVSFTGLSLWETRVLFEVPYLLVL